MKIAEIYKQYKIPPQLQIHQLRVTAVAKIIVNNWTEDTQIDEEAIIVSCLLHDMGNIIKFNLDLYPETLEPEGYDYWKRVQEEFIGKYGNDEHEATFMIAKDLGVGVKIMEILKGWGFSNGKETAGSDSFEAKIAKYADQRVDIDGITSMKERHNGARERYLKRRNFQHLSDKDRFDELAGYWEKIEKQIIEENSD